MSIFSMACANQCYGLVPTFLMWTILLTTCLPEKAAGKGQLHLEQQISNADEDAILARYRRAIDDDLFMLSGSSANVFIENEFGGPFNTIIRFINCYCRSYSTLGCTLRLKNQSISVDFREHVVLQVGNDVLDMHNCAQTEPLEWIMCGPRFPRKVLFPASSYNKRNGKCISVGVVEPFRCRSGYALIKSNAHFHFEIRTEATRVETNLCLGALTEVRDATSAEPWASTEPSLSSTIEENDRDANDTDDFIEFEPVVPEPMPSSTQRPPTVTTTRLQFYDDINETDEQFTAATTGIDSAGIFVVTSPFLTTKAKESAPDTRSSNTKAIIIGSVCTVVSVLAILIILFCVAFSRQPKASTTLTAVNPAYIIPDWSGKPPSLVVEPHPEKSSTLSA